MQPENIGIPHTAVKGQTMQEFSEKFTIFLNKSLAFLPSFFTMCRYLLFECKLAIPAFQLARSLEK